MKPFVIIILIFFALARVDSDGHRSTAHTLQHTININDINNIATNSNYTKNVVNNGSFSTFIVTPVTVLPTSSSASASASASITSLASSTITDHSSSTATTPATTTADAALATTPTIASTSRDKRGTNFGLDQSEIARQNQITQQILSNYLERRLFPNIGVTQKIPTIAEILPKSTSTTTTTTTTTPRPRARNSLRRPRPRGFSVSSPSFRRGSAAAGLRKAYGQRKTPNSLQQLLKYKNHTRKQNVNDHREDEYEDEVDADAESEAEAEAEAETEYDSGEAEDAEENASNKTLTYSHRHHRDELDEEAAEEEERSHRPRYRPPYQRYRHHHTYHRHYDDDVEQDGQESLQSVESEQHDHYYKTKGDIFSRDPSENEIDSDCPHCVDETQYMNKWTMPLLKLGEKRYYLGIFFKANWFKATQYCRYHGMHLASISSQEENDRLEKHIKDFGLGNEHFWISGTDLADEGNFFWMATGRPITFTNWNAGEPNNFRYENGEEENCMELWNRDGKGLKWNDSPCSFETYFVCEVQP